MADRVRNCARPKTNSHLRHVLLPLVDYSANWLEVAAVADAKSDLAYSIDGTTVAERLTAGLVAMRCDFVE